MLRHQRPEAAEQLSASIPGRAHHLHGEGRGSHALICAPDEERERNGAHSKQEQAKVDAGKCPVRVDGSFDMIDGPNLEPEVRLSQCRQRHCAVVPVLSSHPDDTKDIDIVLGAQRIEFFIHLLDLRVELREQVQFDEEPATPEVVDRFALIQRTRVFTDLRDAELRPCFAPRRELHPLLAEDRGPGS